MFIVKFSNRALTETKFKEGQLVLDNNEMWIELQNRKTDKEKKWTGTRRGHSTSFHKIKMIKMFFPTQVRVSGEM